MADRPGSLPPLPRRPRRLASGIILGLVLAAARPPESWSRSLLLTDFDGLKGTPFSFKDEKGTRFKVTTPRYDGRRNDVLLIDYRVVKGGWGGWGLNLNGIDAGPYATLTLMLKGGAGGEKFEIGLRDANNVEKKVPVTQFTDLGREWQKVRIPLSLFEGVNLGSLANVNLGFSDWSADGEVYVDDIQFETEERSDKDRTATGTFANKVTVDGFERANQSDVYRVYEGDDSSLKLESSRIVKEGDYALEMQYTLSTTRPWGSWVSAQWQSRNTTLDWRGTQEVRLWVKGDGSGNVLKFLIVDSDGEKWVYEDREVLKTARWELVEMPVYKFDIEEKISERNRKLDLGEVRNYAVIIEGLGGTDTTSGQKTTEGRIQVDQLTLLGEQISTVWSVAPEVAEKEKVRLLKTSNIDLNGFLFTEFFYAPERKSTVNHFGRVIVNGKIGNYSARFEIASEGQNFGEAARYDVAESTASGTTVLTQSPRLIEPSIQGFANNLSPYLTQLTVGNVFVDYSPFTFSPVFGFKGMSAEGDVDLVNYHFFVLKHRYDSFTIGTRGKAFWEGFRMTGITVYYRETAKLSNPALVGADTIKKTDDLELTEVQNDWVYTLDLERRFLDDRFLLGTLYGRNRYSKRASVDRSSPFDPVFANDLAPPIFVDDHMVRARAELNNFLAPGAKVNYEYRFVGTGFKPRYRQNPIVFDDLESDQRGHNARFVENWRGMTASMEYDAIKRLSNGADFRNRLKWGLGYSGFDRLDVAFNQEMRREEYSFTSDRTNVGYFKNERVTSSEIYLRAQLNPKTALFLIPRREDIKHPATGLTFASESLFGKLEYTPITNLRATGEFRTTHYGSKDQEPKGFPFDDNFVRLKIEFDF